MLGYECTVWGMDQWIFSFLSKTNLWSEVQTNGDLILLSYNIAKRGTDQWEFNFHSYMTLWNEVWANGDLIHLSSHSYGKRYESTENWFFFRAILMKRGTDQWELNSSFERLLWKGVRTDGNLIFIRIWFYETRYRPMGT